MRNMRDQVDNQKYLVGEENLDWNRVISPEMEKIFSEETLTKGGPILNAHQADKLWKQAKDAFKKGRDRNQVSGRYLLLGGTQQRLDKFFNVKKPSTF